jgi:hypothetical protein
VVVLEADGLRAVVEAIQRGKKMVPCRRRRAGITQTTTEVPVGSFQDSL